MAEERGIGRDTELILPYGVFAFVLDQTKGHVNTLCGPIKQSLSNTDQMVTFNPESNRFVPSGRQQDAIQTNILAPKGSYVILENPAVTGKQPEPGKAEVMPINTLKMGQIENLAGPQSFPLWPGQNATVVKGHHLRSNQYLLVRVYDDEAAKANWDKSVVKGAIESASTDTHTDEVKLNDVLGISKSTLVTGQIIVIKGTNVAFYIPPTGVEVLTEARDSEEFVRDAVTLERLEYSILLGENGEKSYVIGPAVVFPTPTQQFYVKDGARKFRAFELQPTTGLHVKVIDGYTEGTGETAKTYEAGDEIFITGSDMPIYYPRPEHAIISYGGFEKTFAVAIPGGEGRYVLDRTNGDINLVTGPKMFLPNPIKEVVVRRALTRAECELYFPGNAEVVRINDELRGQNPDNFYGAASASPIGASSISSYNSLESALEDTRMRTRSFASYDDAPTREIAKKAVGADAMNRGTTYTPPRTITLNTKYDGAIRIDVWSGFAVQVVNSKGDRKTILGPQTVILEYDEYLERLSLSKGKPKNNDNRMNTAFLRYISNPVSDIISLKTHDLVNVDIQVKYLVRFDEALKDKWFSIDNYVQYMVDHLRSLIGNSVRTLGVQVFYLNAATILRDIVLGGRTAETERPLRNFEENGMTVYDLELINITVKDDQIATMLAKSRQETLTDAIELDRQVSKLELVKGQESAKRSIASEIASTQEVRDRLDAEQIERDMAATAKAVDADLSLTIKRKESDKAIAEIAKVTSALYLDTKKADVMVDQSVAEAELGRKIILLAKEAEASEIKMKAVQPGLVEALVAAANAGILERVTPQLAALAFVNGQDTDALLGTLLKGTGAEGILDNLRRMSKTRQAGA